MSPCGDDAESLRGLIRHIYESRTVPNANRLSNYLGNASRSLADENPVIRPRDSQGRPGGLVQLTPGLTTVIVPDLHARTDYIARLIDIPLGGETLLEALVDGTAQVVCVGDGFHSEARGAARWKLAWQEYRDGFGRHEAMDEEMAEGLSLMAMVMILKAAVPERFHFLKGNHENVANSEKGGNMPFGKFAWEGQMVKDWFLAFLGSDMLTRWADFEGSLPLLAVGDCFLVSHAEPRRAYSREQLIEYRSSDQLIFDFTWTDNGEAEAGSVDAMLNLYLGSDAPLSLYFGGHRPVRGLYGTRASGRFVQIHNPDRLIAAVIPGGEVPVPDRDIRIIA